MADGRPAPKAVPVDKSPAQPASKARDGYSTRPSLLQRLRRPDERAAWERFVQLYTPLLFHWARTDARGDSSAESLFQRCLAIRERRLGSTHPDVALTLKNLAAHYQACSRFAEAAALARRALAIFEAALGRTHPHTRLCRTNLEPLRQVVRSSAFRRFGSGKPA